MLIKRINVELKISENEKDTILHSSNMSKAVENILEERGFNIKKVVECWVDHLEKIMFVYKVPKNDNTNYNNY